MGLGVGRTTPTPCLLRLAVTVAQRGKWELDVPVAGGAISKRLPLGFLELEGGWCWCCVV